MKKIMVSMLVTSLALMASLPAFAADPHAEGGPSCGQMMAEKAVLPAKMNELMGSVVEMMEAHAAFMATVKSKEAMAEAEGLKKLAQHHRDLAAQFTKTRDAMKAAATWPVAQHDMKKMMADMKIKASMQKVLQMHKEMVALMQKEIAEMEKPMAANTK